MRLKNIPTDAIEAVKDHPYIVGGGLILVLGLGYIYINSPASEPLDNTSYDPNFSSTPSYYSPIAYNGGTEYPSGTISSTTVAGSNNDVTTRELFDFEKLKASQEYEIAQLTIKQQADISAANQALAAYGVQSANYIAASGLAQAFFYGGGVGAAGTITGPEGANFSFSFANAPLDTSKKGRATTNFNSALSGLNNFMSNIGITNNAAFGGTGSINAGSSSGLNYAAFAMPNSGTVATSIAAGYASNGQQQSTSVASPNASTQTNAVNGTGGFRGGIGGLSNSNINIA